MPLRSASIGHGLGEQRIVPRLEGIQNYSPRRHGEIDREPPYPAARSYELYFRSPFTVLILRQQAARFR